MVYVAVLGFGIVGSGVVELLNTNKDKIAASAAQEIRVKYILDIRQFSDSPYASLFTDSFELIENDPEVQIVIETIGGVGAAFDFTKRAILAGKNVVTSNKELVACYGQELLQLAKERNLNYLFEGSVGGGIPILRPITQCLAANEISEVYGILNGTTNYILSQMIKNNLDFNDALYEAREKGYAEADPSSDIQGKDTCRKICILACLSFGCQLLPDQVPTLGIEDVSYEDMAYAKSMDAKIKLIGRAVRVGDRLSAYVAPHLVGPDSILLNVEDVFNGIVVRGNAIGDTMFYGRGAGKLPTASAVVADIIDAAKHFHARKYIYWEKSSDNSVADPALLENRWYVRAEISAANAEHLIPGLQILGEKNAFCAFITPSINRYTLTNSINKNAIRTAYRVLE